jgi:uncharacterized protein (DUF697 family)
MNRKKLPKAIRRTADPPGGMIIAEATLAPQETPAQGTRLERPNVDAPPSSASAPKTEANGARTPSASSTRNALPAMASRRSEGPAARRRSQADAIVERHAVYSGFGGIIPVPVANIASITAIIVRMVKVLSGLYGVPFQRDRARALVIGLMGGTMPTGLAAATTSTLVYIIPVSGLVGLAVSSLTAVACTRSIGRIFVAHFEGGATLPEAAAIEPH